ncbi:hypothetical protein SLNWT_3408 [Streptomyces albus]|uniref:Uncharacterized protein n=1 Tax=Streptomyces albus (strain ATCC 21838 / DSM 41398 / FERM P-419 / JCM 4703 / NBRC 107858) TaxID=1081613 RepID=A0A0B5EQ97_STRA4|nr:hypothetical protein SLNWT_3408 [Streptomyces albus]AOU78090.1 hypothetical protein SLNHY_3399 [Streptomyces albus]AYN33845.1 hypothetical protein DUI70_3344 [Streptomyces albus]
MRHAASGLPRGVHAPGWCRTAEFLTRPGTGLTVAGPCRIRTGFLASGPVFRLRSPGPLPSTDQAARRRHSKSPVADLSVGPSSPHRRAPGAGSGRRAGQSRRSGPWVCSPPCRPFRHLPHVRARLPPGRGATPAPARCACTARTTASSPDSACPVGF